MGNFDTAFNFTIMKEGGYSNHQLDRGGKTMYGITENTFLAAKKIGIVSESILDIKNISLDDAKNIYHQFYWNAISGDLLPESLSIAVFDMAVNSGVGNAAKTLQ